MGTIKNLLIRYWRNTHVVSILILTLLIIIGQSFINPYLKEGVYYVFYSPFAKLRLTVLELSNVAENNQSLLAALVDASLKVSLYEEALKENERLRTILGFEPPPGYRLIPAEVISITSQYIPTGVVINRGEKDSIIVDMPVINREGLIGRISFVGPDYAEVQLLTEPTNRVAARLAQSREMGIIRYHGNDGMRLENFPIQGTVAVRDTVISSGLGGVYPPGLFVGTVTKVTRPELAPFCTIEVKPAANFFSIEELFILQDVTP